MSTVKTRSLKNASGGYQKKFTIKLKHCEWRWFGCTWRPRQIYLSLQQQIHFNNPITKLAKVRTPRTIKVIKTHCWRWKQQSLRTLPQHEKYQKAFEESHIFPTHTGAESFKDRSNVPSALESRVHPEKKHTNVKAPMSFIFDTLC